MRGKPSIIYQCLGQGWYFLVSLHSSRYVRGIVDVKAKIGEEFGSSKEGLCLRFAVRTMVRNKAIYGTEVISALS